MNWQVYLLNCSDGTYYCGSTTNVERRVKQHQEGKGGAYTRCRRPVKLLMASRQLKNRSEAQSLEAYIKRQPRNRKLAMLYFNLKGA